MAVTVTTETVVVSSGFQLVKLHLGAGKLNAGKLCVSNYIAVILKWNDGYTET